MENGKHAAELLESAIENIYNAGLYEDVDQKTRDVLERSMGELRAIKAGFDDGIPWHERKLKQGFVESLEWFSENSDPDALAWLDHILVERDSHGQASLIPVWVA